MCDVGEGEGLPEKETLIDFFRRMKKRYLLLGSVLLIFGIPTALLWGIILQQFIGAFLGEGILSAPQYQLAGGLFGTFTSYVGLALFLYGLLAPIPKSSSSIIES